MSSAFDLDAYLDRIGYAGGRAPTLATLAGLQLGHVQSIAFENLDPLLGWPVSLDIGALQDKLVRSGRGGYCFEQNLLFKHGLEALGFEVTGLAARVVLNQPPGSSLPRTHMLLKVDLADGPVIADAGFGGTTPTAPLRLGSDRPQATPHESFRVVRADTDRRLDAQIGDAWTPLYRFDLQEQIDADYEMMNFYASMHPASVFRNRLIAARAFPGGRWALNGNALARHALEGGTQRRSLVCAADIRDALRDVFAIRAPAGSGPDDVFDRFAATTG